jgi:hypothetical protein
MAGKRGGKRKFSQARSTLLKAAWACLGKTHKSRPSKRRVAIPAHILRDKRQAIPASVLRDMSQAIPATVLRGGRMRRRRRY